MEELPPNFIETETDSTLGILYNVNRTSRRQIYIDMYSVKSEYYNKKRISIVYENIIYHFITKDTFNSNSVFINISETIATLLLFHRYDETKVANTIIQNTLQIIKNHSANDDRINLSMSFDMTYINSQYFNENKFNEYIDDFMVSNMEMILLNLNNFTMKKITQYNEDNLYHLWFIISLACVSENKLKTSLFNTFENQTFYGILYNFRTPIRNELAQHPLRLVSD